MSCMLRKTTYSLCRDDQSDGLRPTGHSVLRYEYFVTSVVSYVPRSVRSDLYYIKGEEGQEAKEKKRR